MENESTEEILRLIKKCTISVQTNAARIDEIDILLNSGTIEADEEAKELFDEKDHLEHTVSELEKDIAMYEEILHVRELNEDATEEKPPVEKTEPKQEEEQQPEYDADDEEYQDEEEYDEEDEDDGWDCDGPEPSYESCYADPYMMPTYIADYQSGRYDGWDEVFTGGDY